MTKNIGIDANISKIIFQEGADPAQPIASSRLIYAKNDGFYGIDSAGVVTGPFGSGGGGEVNTATNVGTDGVGLFKQKTGVDLEFYSISPGSTKITTSLDVPTNAVQIDVVEAQLDHNSINNLAVGDVHTQYGLLSGRSGGQHYRGGFDASDNITIESTAHATKGRIRFGAAGALGSIDAAGQLALPTTGSTGGLLIGGDVALYRSAADTLFTDATLRIEVPTLSRPGVAIRTTDNNAAFSPLKIENSSGVAQAAFNASGHLGIGIAPSGSRNIYSLLSYPSASGAAATGIDNIAWVTGSTAFTSLTAMANQARVLSSNTVVAATGLANIVDHSGSGVLGTASGAVMQLGNGAAGATNNGYALSILNPFKNSTGEIANYRAISVNDTTTSITNTAYGLYIGDITGAPVNYAIYTSTGLVRFGDDVEIDGDLNHDGTNIGFYGTAPVAQAAALTTALTQITHTGPTTPDYAIATPIDSGAGSAWGFSTQDEFETTMSVILNLQTRLDELETADQAYGLLQ